MSSESINCKSNTIQKKLGPALPMDRLFVVILPIVQSNGYLENTFTASWRRFKLYIELYLGYMQILHDFPGGCASLNFGTCNWFSIRQPDVHEAPLLLAMLLTCVQETACHPLQRQMDQPLSKVWFACQHQWCSVHQEGIKREDLVCPCIASRSAGCVKVVAEKYQWMDIHKESGDLGLEVAENNVLVFQVLSQGSQCFYWAL